MKPQHKIILITGGIGSGKSVVSRILRLSGHIVVDTDMVARLLIDSNQELRRLIIDRWGNDAYCARGLNRQFVADRIFNDSDERRWLNARVHPRVCREVERISSGADGPVFVECAIPVTSGLSAGADVIWLVSAPEEVRIERACRRDSSDADSIRKRIRTQDAEFAALPPDKVCVIDNDGAPLLPQITRLLKPIYP